MLTDVEKAPLRAALDESRREQLAHGHDWDVADALAAVVEVLDANPILPDIVICSDERHQQDLVMLRDKVNEMIADEKKALERLQAIADEVYEIPEAQQRVRAMHSALAELVRVKGLKNEAEGYETLAASGPMHPADLERARALIEQHRYAAPLAWMEARRALADLQPGDV